MNLQTLFGPDLFTEIIFIISFIILAVLVYSTIYTVFYHRILYIRTKKKNYSSDFKPRCSVIIPCKGFHEVLKKNLESFLKMDYPDYEVIFTVESGDDSAFPVIREIIKDYPERASLTVAGYTKECAQKNYNQLAALKNTSSPEVYVFADSDIRPLKNWLGELVIPLSNENITATTGFRWQSSGGGIGEQVHSYFNNVVYVLFNFAASVLKVGLWGGAMAIRKEDFEKMDVAGRWSKCVVDDMSLSKILMKHPGKTVLVPPCVTHTEEAIETVGQSIVWFERQVMFLKGCHFFTWLLLALPVSMFLICLYLLLPVSLIAGLLSAQRNFLHFGGGASLFFVVGAMFTVLLFPFLGKNRKFCKFLFLQPLSFFFLIISVFMTAFTNTIHWGGIEYKMGRGGSVTSIKRHT